MGLAALQLFKFHPETNTNFSPPSSEEISNSKQTRNVHQELIDIIQNLTTRNNNQLPLFKHKSSPFTRRIPPKIHQSLNSWTVFLNTHCLFSKIIEFLPIEEWRQIRYCSKSILRQIQIKILSNDNNWNLTLQILTPYLQRETAMKQSGISDDYEHSEDLDRTSGYFQNQNTEDVTEHQFKLDRIVTTLSFKIKYFQGIMPICASLLQCFNENTSYWLLRYLLYKCRYIQTNVQFYHSFVLEMDVEFKRQLPQVYKHLEECGFELNYFVMKWIMGLFAEDMSKTMLLAFWDALCQTDVYFIMYLIIEIFKYLGRDILQCSSDQINEMLKLQLKDRLSLLKSEQLMRQTKELYIERRLSLGKS